MLYFQDIGSIGVSAAELSFKDHIRSPATSMNGKSHNFLFAFHTMSTSCRISEIQEDVDQKSIFICHLLDILNDSGSIGISPASLACKVRMIGLAGIKSYAKSIS